MSPALSAKLDGVIDVANRANVTVYAVDAQGLRQKAGGAGWKKELEAFAEERQSQVSIGVDRTEQPLTMAMEQVEATLGLDSRTGLARLASHTGGFSSSGQQSLVRIPPHRRGQSVSLPAHLRAAQRHARRPLPRDSRQGPAAGRRTSSPRSGYRACAAAATPPRPTSGGDGAARAGRWRTRSRCRPPPSAFRAVTSGALSLLVHVSRAVAFRRESGGRPTRASPSRCASATATGNEAQRLSQEYVLSGDAAEIEAARKGDISSIASPKLKPGVYTSKPSSSTRSRTRAASAFPR